MIFETNENGFVSCDNHTQRHYYGAISLPRSKHILRQALPLSTTKRILNWLVLASAIKSNSALLFTTARGPLRTKSTIFPLCSNRNTVLQRINNNMDNTSLALVRNVLEEITDTEAEQLSFPPVNILDQNEYYMVIEKPPSVVCHHSPWTGSKKTKLGGSTTMETTAEIPILQRVREQTGRRVNLVHRLDRGSSGCLLLTFADDMATATADTVVVPPWNMDENDNSRSTNDNKVSIYSPEHDSLPINSTKATAILSEAMADKVNCTKTYVALVRGEGILHGEDLKQKGWFLIERAIKNENGVEKNASTWFRFIAGQDNNAGTIDRPRASLVLARPQTGRWHQIRKHLNGLSHPILGDTTHGSSRTNREWKEVRNMPSERTCLHLSQMKIGVTEVCPNGIHVTCPLASDMMTLLHDHLPNVLSTAIPILKEEGIIL